MQEKHFNWMEKHFNSMFMTGSWLAAIFEDVLNKNLRTDPYQRLYIMNRKNQYANCYETLIEYTLSSNVICQYVMHSINHFIYEPIDMLCYVVWRDDVELVTIDERTGGSFETKWNKKLWALLISYFHRVYFQLTRLLSV